MTTANYDRMNATLSGVHTENVDTGDCEIERTAAEYDTLRTGTEQTDMGRSSCPQRTQPPKPVVVLMSLDGEPVTTGLDTGAAVSMISERP